MLAGEEKEKKDSFNSKELAKSSFDALQEAIPDVFFPPCIEKMLSGLEDGKKRSIFILINFLKSVGWSYELIEEKIKEWNKKNPDPLKETIIVGQLRYHKRSEKILPPNCENKMYYIDMRVCNPDNLCKRVKNPVNYAIIKAKIEKKSIKGIKRIKKEV